MEVGNNVVGPPLTYTDEEKNQFKNYFRPPPQKRSRGRPKGSKKKRRGGNISVKNKANADKHAIKTQQHIDEDVESRKRAEQAVNQDRPVIDKQTRSKKKRVNWDQGTNKVYMDRVVTS